MAIELGAMPKRTFILCAHASTIEGVGSGVQAAGSESTIVSIAIYNTTMAIFGRTTLERISCYRPCRKHSSDNFGFLFYTFPLPAAYDELFVELSPG